MTTLLHFWHDEEARDRDRIWRSLAVGGFSVVIVADSVNSIGTSVKGLFADITSSRQRPGK